MKAFLITIIMALPSFSFAATCPDNITLKFGVIEETTSSQMKHLQIKDLEFVKTKDRGVCQYYNADEFLLTIKLGNDLLIQRPPFDENLGYSLRVDLDSRIYRFILPHELRLNTPTFNHYYIEYDEEDDRALGVGNKIASGHTRFNDLVIIMR